MSITKAYMGGEKTHQILVCEGTLAEERRVGMDNLLR